MAQRPRIPSTRRSSTSSIESLAYAGHNRVYRTSSPAGSRESTSLSDVVDTRTPFKDSRSTYSAHATMTVEATRVVIKWETESKAYIHTIPRVDVPASRGQKELLNNQYIFLKSGCGGSIGSAHSVSVKWRQKDEVSSYTRDRDGLNRYETKVISFYHLRLGKSVRTSGYMTASLQDTVYSACAGASTLLLTLLHLPLPFAPYLTEAEPF